jgi:imidazoleglycerol phosphate dehydratase HisB
LLIAGWEKADANWDQHDETIEKTIDDTTISMGIVEAIDDTMVSMVVVVAVVEAMDDTIVSMAVTRSARPHAVLSLPRWKNWTPSNEWFAIFGCGKGPPPLSTMKLLKNIHF